MTRDDLLFIRDIALGALVGLAGILVGSVLYLILGGKG